jgi:hypothetical protein
MFGFISGGGRNVRGHHLSLERLIQLLYLLLIFAFLPKCFNEFMVLLLNALLFGLRRFIGGQPVTEMPKTRANHLGVCLAVI